MTGIICSVRGCHNNWKKRNQSLSQPCLEHGTKRSECCGPAFNLYPPPSKEEELHCWLQALNVKKPPKRPYVCSFHFVDKRPTAQHPYPEKWLGHGYKACSKMPKRAPLKQGASWGRKYPTARSDEKSKPDHDYTTSSSVEQPSQSCPVPPGLHAEILLSDPLSLHYTGLPLSAFTFLSDLLLRDYTNTFPLDACDQILMTLMKLRLNSAQADLAERFRVSQSRVNAVTSEWLDIMEEKMKCFVRWLPRETILSSLPQCFKEHYPSTTCVIDCSEIPLQKPRNLNAKGQSHSHFYNQSTIKYLVATAPCGLIMFVSAAYGGRCSDKFMTSDSGFLEFLQPGDEVMADEGWVISDLLHERRVKLVTPTTAEREMQLSEEDPIASVRIHVEKVVRRLKNFKILSQTVPLDLTWKYDKILTICAALSNLQGNDTHEDKKDE